MVKKVHHVRSGSLKELCVFPKMGDELNPPNPVAGAPVVGSL